MKMIKDAKEVRERGEENSDKERAHDVRPK
jgi:hypothetical protein